MHMFEAWDTQFGAASVIVGTHFIYMSGSPHAVLPVQQLLLQDVCTPDQEMAMSNVGVIEYVAPGPGPLVAGLSLRRQREGAGAFRGAMRHRPGESNRARATAAGLGRR